MDTHFRPFFSLAALAIGCVLSGVSAHAATPDAQIRATVDRYAEHIFYNSGATGMALVAIDGKEQLFRSYGETRPGNNQRPRPDSLIRIASLTKLMTSEVLVKLDAEGKVKLTDPLSRYAPPGKRVPTNDSGRPIRLMHLASHTSGLPREQPGGAANRAVFTWPTYSQRWQWLQRARLSVAPGSAAAYSNLGYDLLADALAHATHQSYPALFQRLITRPLGMSNTTYTPTAAQCARLMIPARSASPCISSLAAIGSGGVYSTPDDMRRWMQQFLAGGQQPRSPYAARLLKMYYPRAKLNQVKGMDVPGKAAALGLGWVAMAPQDGHPGIIQKTGGAGGFITYMALIPEKNIGVFVVVTRSDLTRFKNMSDGVNDLVSALAAQKR